MHVCICKFMWHRIGLLPHGTTIKFHSFIHSFMAIISMLCVHVYVCVLTSLSVCFSICVMCVFMWLWVGFACVDACAYVSGVDCMVHRLMSSFVGKKNLLIGMGNGGGGCTAANKGREWC